MKRVIGIDPSISNTAVCVLSENGEMEMETFKAGKITGKTVSHRINRFLDHAWNIADFVCRRDSDTLLILIEGYSFGSKGNAITAICEFGGLLRARISTHGHLHLSSEVAPGTLKRFATGKGNAPKDIVCARLAQRYDVELGSNDEYDAFGLAKLAACVVGWDEPSNDAQRKAVATIREHTNQGE